MIKNFIKNQPLLWALTKPLRKLRSWRRSEHCKLGSHYRETVVGGELLLRVNNIAGMFHLPATSDLARRIVTEGCYESEVTASLEKFLEIRGSILNVGANIGLLACYFANSFQKIDKVFAIEPNPEAFRYLCRNIHLNDLDARIHPMNICIGADERDVEFHFVEGKPEYSSIGGVIHPSVSNHKKAYIMVPQKPLSALNIGDHVSLMFVDVEGAEECVFRGAEGVLKDQHPILYFECSDSLLRKFGCSSRGLEKYLNSLGYSVRNALNDKGKLEHPYEGEAIAIYIDNSEARNA